MKVVKPYILLYGIRDAMFYLTGVNWEDKMVVEVVAVTHNSLLERHLRKISGMKKIGFFKTKVKKVKPNKTVKTVAKSESVEKETEGVKPNETVGAVAKSESVENKTECVKPNETVGIVAKNGNIEKEIEKKNEKKGVKKILKILRSIGINAIGGVVTTAIIAALAWVSGVISDIKSIPNMATKEDIVNMATKEDIADMATKEDIDDMVTKEDIADMATTADIGYMSGTIEDLAKRIEALEKDNKTLFQSIGRIEGRLGTLVDPNEDYINRINAACNSYDSAYNESDNCVWMDLSQEVGKDFITGDPYTAEDLENDTVIFSYIDENNDEVFFKGTFNEDNRWEGNCIINKYANGNLKYIMNANYESGKLKTYNMVFSYVNSSNTEVWAISSRTVEEEGNAGETWTYFKEREYKKDFNNQYLTAENIINEEYFYNVMNMKMEGYYNGYTSDGRFNDGSENAYMVKYTMDGHIRMFYSGRFADGQPQDPEGNALVIAFGHDEENYYYYNGKIDDISKIGNGWTKIPVDEVKKKIMNSNYLGPLVLYGEVV